MKAYNSLGSYRNNPCLKDVPSMPPATHLPKKQMASCPSAKFSEKRMLSRSFPTKDRLHQHDHGTVASQQGEQE